MVCLCFPLIVFFFNFIFFRLSFFFSFIFFTWRLITLQYCSGFCHTLTWISHGSFIVSCLTFRSLIHLEFIFVYGLRKCSSFILLHVAVQFSQHHLLKRLSLPSLHILASFVKNKVPIGTWVYFYLVPLVYISVFMSVPYCLDDCSFAV